MKASQIITDVRRELLESNADASFWTDSELLRLINRAQFDFINRTRLLEDEAKLSLQVGRNNYPLPSNWISSKAVYHFKTVDGKKSQRRLRASDLERMSREVPNFLDIEDTNRYDRPNRYWVWGNEIYIDPPPDEVEDNDLWLFYKAKPRRINSENEDLDTPEELAEAITAYVLWKAWTKESETQKATDQAAIYLDYIGQGLRYVKRKTGDRQGKIDTGAPTAFSGTSDPGFNPLLP